MRKLRHKEGDSGLEMTHPPVADPDPHPRGPVPLLHPSDSQLSGVSDELALDSMPVTLTKFKS